MEQYTSEDARREWRRILNEVERGAPVGVTRYGKSLAVIVPAEWFEGVMDALALADWQETVARLRQARRKLGLSPRDTRVVHHIDGDPANNDVANLELRDPQENPDTKEQDR